MDGSAALVGLGPFFIDRASKDRRAMLRIENVMIQHENMQKINGFSLFAHSTDVFVSLQVTFFAIKIFADRKCLKSPATPITFHLAVNRLLKS